MVQGSSTNSITVASLAVAVLCSAALVADVLRDKGDNQLYVSLVKEQLSTNREMLGTLREVAGVLQSINENARAANVSAADTKNKVDAIAKRKIVVNTPAPIVLRQEVYPAKSFPTLSPPASGLHFPRIKP